MLKDLTRTLDLPPDSTVPVLSGQEAGDVWHVPGGFVADLSIRDAAGKMLSENHYDFTEEEIQRFWTSVYPPAPISAGRCNCSPRGGGDSRRNG